MSNNRKIETICVQGGYTPGNGEPRQVPIVQSTTFKYDTSEDMGKLFDLKRRATSIPACKIPPATPLPPRSPKWKAAWQVC